MLPASQSITLRGLWLKMATLRAGFHLEDVEFECLVKVIFLFR